MGARDKRGVGEPSAWVYEGRRVLAEPAFQFHEAGRWNPRQHVASDRVGDRREGEGGDREVVGCRARRTAGRSRRHSSEVDLSLSMNLISEMDVSFSALFDLKRIGEKKMVN